MSDYGEFPHCGRRECPCPHQKPCVAGYIWTVLIKDGREYDAVRPCPRCQPARQSTLAEKTAGLGGRRQWLARLRTLNAKNAKNSSSDEW